MKAQPVLSFGVIDSEEEAVADKLFELKKKTPFDSAKQKGSRRKIKSFEIKAVRTEPKVSVLSLDLTQAEELKPLAKKDVVSAKAEDVLIRPNKVKSEQNARNVSEMIKTSLKSKKMENIKNYGEYSENFCFDEEDKDQYGISGIHSEFYADRDQIELSKIKREKMRGKIFSYYLWIKLIII